MKVQKLQNKTTRGVLIIVIGILITSPLSEGVTTSDIWSEDFLDSTGWYLNGYKANSYYYENTTYSPIIENESLQMPNNRDPTYLSIAAHNSTVAYGTWSFDWIVKPDVNETHKHSCNLDVIFITNLTQNLDGIPTSWKTNAYAVYGLGLVSDEHSRNPDYSQSMIFWKVSPYSSVKILKISSLGEKIVGTHHIDITRTDEGTFRFYFDYDVETNPNPEFSYTDNEITSSESFTFAGHMGDSIIDNVLVNTSVTIPPPDPSTTDEITQGFTFGLIFLVINILFWLKRKQKRK